MQDQPKYKYLRSTEFFTDGRSARPLVENTVARGHLDEDSVFYTGMVNGQPAHGVPYRDQPAGDRPRAGTLQYLLQSLSRSARQRTRYDRAARFQTTASVSHRPLRQVGVGHFFDVMTNGYGAMWKYSAQIEPRDRWAIAAYIRVLQASQNTNVNDLSADERSKLPTSQQAHAVPAPPYSDNPTPVTETGGPK